MTAGEIAGVALGLLGAITGVVALHQSHTLVQLERERRVEELRPNLSLLSGIMAMHKGNERQRVLLIGNQGPFTVDSIEVDSIVGGTESVLLGTYRRDVPAIADRAFNDLTYWTSTRSTCDELLVGENRPLFALRVDSTKEGLPYLALRLWSRRGDDRWLHLLEWRPSKKEIQALTVPVPSDSRAADPSE